MQHFSREEQGLSIPTYSILIPVYERIYGFVESLESALSVTECKEILVVDDNSSHNDFRSICSTYSDARIRYVRNEKNLGLFGNWNNAVSLATSEFVSILCSDDLISPDIFKCFLKFFQQDPNIDVFFGSFVTFSKSIHDAKVIKCFPAGKVSVVGFLEDAVDSGPGFPVLTVTRRDKLLALPFVSSPHSGNDWLWIWSNASKLNLYAIDRLINFWRRHKNQDAVVSQAVTMDCWPLMYMQISEQLKILRSKKFRKAKRLATGIILNFLVNDKKHGGLWVSRLAQEKSRTNYFFL